MRSCPEERHGEGLGRSFGGGRAASCPPKPVREVVVTMPGRAGRQSYGTGGIEKMLSFPSANGEFGLGVSLWANSKAKNNPNLLRDTDWGCSDSKPREQLHRTPNSLNLGLAKIPTQHSICRTVEERGFVSAFLLMGPSFLKAMSTACLHQ